MLSKHLIISPILVPMITAIFLLLPSVQQHIARQRVIASAGLAITLATAWGLFMQTLEQVSVYALGNWEAPFGIWLVADSFSAILVLLCSFLAFVVHIYACAGDDERGTFFHPIFLFQVLGLNGAFLTGDLFNLFVFFEILLIASYSLMAHGGGKARTQSNIHYVYLNLIGSSLFLIALGTLYGTLGTLNMAHMAQRVSELDSNAKLLCLSGAALLLVVFSLKAAIAPLQLWLKQTYANASTPVAALFVIMTKVGIYSIWRVHGSIFGDNAGEFAHFAMPILWPLALITIAFGALGMFSSQSLRSLTANLVLVSAGTLILCVAHNQLPSSQAAIYYLVQSTLATAAMFLIAGLVHQVRGKLGDRLVGGRAMPSHNLLGALFMLTAIALIGMPPLPGFIGKAMILNALPESAWQAWSWGMIIFASLLALVSLSRAGTIVFWHIRGTADAALSIDKRQLIAITLLLLPLLLMVVFAGQLSELALNAAQQLHTPHSLATILEANPW